MQTTRKQENVKKKKAFTRLISNWRLGQYRYLLSHSIYAFNNQNAVHSWRNTRLPESFVPKEFHPLFAIKDEELVFTTCTHSSTKHIPQILREGALYSSQLSGKIGMCNQFDIQRGDGALVFTSVGRQYQSNYITFSIPALCAIQRFHNNGENVIVKFYDWAEMHESNLDIMPGIQVKNSYGNLAKATTMPTHSEFVFHFEGDELHTTTVQIPIEKMMYYGYRGLNNYVRYFIFYIIESLPEDRQSTKNKIYAYFLSMDVKTLHRHLTRLARELLKNAELNFHGCVSLDHFMIKAIKMDDHVTNLDELRHYIKQGDLHSFQKTIFDERVYHLLAESDFIVDGLVDYAIQCDQSLLARFIQRTFGSLFKLDKIARYQAHFNTISSEVIDHIYAVLSQPYLLAPSDFVSFDSLIAYRPYHGVVHTITAAFLIPFIMELILIYGKQPYASEINENDTGRYICAALYLVSGRESEASFKQNRELYQSFRLKSARFFKDFFQNRDEFDPQQLADFTKAVLELGTPTSIATMDVVLNIAHKAVLGRVFSKERMQIEREYINNIFREPFATFVTTAILGYATSLLEIVGDEIETSFCEQVKPRSRNIPKFVKLSQRSEFSTLIENLSAVPQPLLRPTSDHGVRTFPEINAFELDEDDKIPEVDFDTFIEPAEPNAEFLVDSFYCK